MAPYVVVAVGLLGYNHARFGSLFDFGANYNLTVNDMTKRGMNVGRLAPALFAYFLQPPCASGVFPFIQPAPFDTTYLGQTIKEVTFGGILACLPVLWILPFAPRILRLRMKARSTRTIMGVIVVLLVSGVAVALLDAEMAGILQRYYADFGFMFLAAAVLLAFVVNENLEAGSVAKDLLMKVLIVLVAAERGVQRASVLRARDGLVFRHLSLGLPGRHRNGPVLDVTQDLAAVRGQPWRRGQRQRKQEKARERKRHGLHRCGHVRGHEQEGRRRDRGLPCHEARLRPGPGHGLDPHRPVRSTGEGLRRRHRSASPTSPPSTWTSTAASTPTMTRATATSCRRTCSTS